MVLQEKTWQPKGKAIEILGFYNPHTKEKNFQAERINYWISKGAQMTPTLHNLLVDAKVIDGPKVKAWTAKPKKKKDAEQMPKSVEQAQKDDVDPATEDVKLEVEAEPKAETPATEEKASPEVKEPAVEESIEVKNETKEEVSTEAKEDKSEPEAEKVVGSEIREEVSESAAEESPEPAKAKQEA